MRIKKHGFKNIRYYFIDFETYMPNSWYYEKYQDTVPFIVSIVSGQMEYNKEKQQLESVEKINGKYDRHIKVIANTNGVVEETIRYYTSKKVCEKLGYDKIFYFHNGGKFDMFFIIPILKRIAINTPYDEVEKEEIKINQLYFTTLWSDNYREITIFKYISNGESKKNVKRYKKITMTIRDSYYLFKSPLKALGKLVGINKGDTLKSIDNANKQRVETKDLMNDKELVEYVINDSYILAKFFERMCKFFPKSTIPPTTTASWAQAKYLENKRMGDMNAFDAFRNYTMNLDIDSQLQLNQIFQTWYKGGLSTLKEESLAKEIHNVYVEDVTSQYPDKMKNWRMPVGIPKRFQNEEDFNEYFTKNKDKIESGEYVCFMNYIYYEVAQDTRVPNFMKNDGETTNPLEGKFLSYRYIHPKWDVKESYQYFTQMEKLLIRYKKKEFVIAYVFEKTKFLFEDYIKFYFELKDKASKRGDAIEKMFAKLMLNTLYGKMGQKAIREVQLFPSTLNKLMEKEDNGIIIVKNEKESDGLGMINVIKETETPFTYFQVAAYITSLSRYWLLKRWNEIISLGGEVHYCDTDSNFFTIPQEGLSKLSFGKNLGEWNLEEENIPNGYIVAAKAYMLYDKDKNIVKCACKGVDKEQVIKYGVKHFVNNEPYINMIRKTTPNGVILVDFSKKLMSESAYTLLKQISKAQRELLSKNKKKSI